MTDKLKFTVTYTRTVNLGNYESEKYGASQEFYRGECPMDYAFRSIIEEVENIVQEKKSDE